MIFINKLDKAMLSLIINIRDDPFLAGMDWKMGGQRTEIRLLFSCWLRPPDPRTGTCVIKKKGISAMATVSNLLKVKGKDVWIVQSGTQVKDTLRLMAEKNIGAVLVLDGARIVGVFSERDYARHAARRESMLLNEPVDDFMTRAVYYVSPSQTVEEVMALMTSKHIRHLPVLENDQLVGVISIGDVVKKLMDEKETTIQGLENYILGRDFSH